MARTRLDKVLVVDLEATCWAGDPPPGEVSEIIEIGVAELGFACAPTVLRSASYLVRPVRSRVSPFCTELTGITPEAARRQGRPLSEVCARIRNEFGGAGKTWVAWGRDDRDLARDCTIAGIAFPFSDSFLDLGQIYGLLSGAERAVGLSQALGDLGLTFDGTPHRAGDDAINTARVMAAIADRLGLRPSVAPAP